MVGLFIDGTEKLTEQMQHLIKNIFLHTVINEESNGDFLNLFVYWKKQTFPRIFESNTHHARTYIEDLDNFQKPFFESVDLNYAVCVFADLYKFNGKCKINDEKYYIRDKDTDVIWDDRKKLLTIKRQLDPIIFQKGKGFYLWSTKPDAVSQQFRENSFSIDIPCSSQIEIQQRKSIIRTQLEEPDKALKNKIRKMIAFNDLESATEELFNLVRNKI